MRRLPVGAIPLLLLGLSACSDRDDYTYSPNPYPPTTSGALNSGASGSNNQPAVVVGTAPAQTVVTPLTADGVNFIFQAAYSGVGEVHMGQLAIDRAASPRVRDVAAIMIRDHTMANTALDSVGNTKGVVPPAVEDSGRQTAAVILRGLQGSLFDREYVQMQITEHRVALALFGAEAQSGQDPDLRSFASEYLPMLQHHLDLFTALGSEMLVSSR